MKWLTEQVEVPRWVPVWLGVLLVIQLPSNIEGWVNWLT